MNKKQRVILAIFIPVIIFFVALIIANSVGYTVTIREFSKSSYLNKYMGATYHKGNPFNWGRTWYVWMFYLIFCCIFEYKLFREKKRKIINN